MITERVNLGRVLCPIDLLPDSGEAIRYAASFAQACGAELLICHCRGPAQLEEGVTEDSVARYVRAGLNDAPLRPRVVVVDGDPVVAISRVAADKHVDLIVMRSRRAHHANALLGSIAEAVCRTAPCPVLVTHQDFEQGRTIAGRLFRRVLVAYDFSTDAELALSYGLHLARKHEAELHLVHVLPWRPKPEAPEVAMLPLSAGQGFRDMEDRLRSANLEQNGLASKIKHVVRAGQPYRELLAYAEEQDVDLICMGASGSGFGLNALFGSNADRVIRQARCPVIVARPLKPTMPRESEQQAGLYN